MKTGKRLVPLLVILMIVISQGSHQSNAQKKRNPQSQSLIADSGWPAYGRDPGGSRYSPLAEINRENVNNLKVAMDVSHRRGGRQSRARQKCRVRSYANS